MVYMTAMIVQLFFPCYLASQLTSQSDQLSKHIFQAKWWNQSAKFKRIMMIFTIRANRPIEPMAGGLFVIGLPMFVSV